MDSARFSYLNANMGSGECGTTYTAFRNAVYSNWYNDPQLYLLGSDSTLWTWTINSGWAGYQSQFVATLYRLNYDTLELKRCRFILSELNEYFDTLDFSHYDWYTNETTIRRYADMGGILLDWTYDRLPQALRQHTVQNLYKVTRYFMNTYILSASGNSYVSSHNAWNTVYANQFALVLDDADGLTVLEKDTVQQWYHSTYDKFENGFFPCYGYYRDDDGGWNWTAAYAMWSLVDQFQLFENMRIATGKDYYHDLPWVQNSINQYWYFIQPDGWTINWGDGFTNLQADRVVYRHAQIFNDPRSLWLAQFYSQPANITWTVPLFQKFIYKDYGMPVVSKPDIAHDWFSDKTGLSVSRTGWDSSSTLVWMYNAPTKKSAHEHRENNSFCVYRHKPQIIHSGYYASYGDAHYINYYMRSIAHNTLCVMDSAASYTNWGVPVSNDGGQKESPTLMNLNDIHSANAHRGEWVLWGSGSNYCYMIGDASASYDTAKLDRFTRRLFYWKPDLILMLDHVHLKNTQTAQRDAKFVLHFQQQPQLSGNLLSSSVPGNIDTYDGRDVYQANGKGNVAIRTLLPLNSTTTRIGGAGYEFYVDGQNYPVNGTMDTIHTTPGRWRIEVSPPAVHDTLVYFHSIRIGDSLAPAQPQGQVLSSAISYGADMDSLLFFFSSSGDTGLMHHLLPSVSGGRLLTWIAADLHPNQNFDLLIDQVAVANGTSDSNGVLISTNPVAVPPGMHTAEIAQPQVSRWADKPASRMNVYPNPGHHTVRVILPEGTASFRVWNAEGRLMLTASGNREAVISLENYPEGVYLLAALDAAGNTIATSRLVRQ